MCKVLKIETSTFTVCKLHVHLKSPAYLYLLLILVQYDVANASKWRKKKWVCGVKMWRENVA